MKRLGLVCGAVAIVVLGTPALAVDPDGSVVKALPDADATGPVGSRLLEVDSPVYLGDKIVTSDEGEAQIVLSDDTKLVVGPQSTLMIDEFILQSDEERTVAINAVKGAFRFISGGTRKDKYNITTPTATIGIRGTEFDFTVEEDGGTSIALFSGEVDVCDRAQQVCVELTAACDIAVVDPALAPRVLSESVSETMAARFPYLEDQGPLRPDFRVDETGCRVVTKG